MAITYFAGNYFVGLSSDSKPAAPEQSRFFETDTGNSYRVVGGSWVQDAAASGAEILSDVQASRPSASSNNGALFLPTDGHYPSLSNGSSWDTYPIPGFKATNPPTYDSFSKIGTDSQDTIAADGDGLIVTSIGKASASVYASAWVIALPSAPYTLIVGMDLMCLLPSTGIGFGVCLTDGTSTSALQVIAGYTANTNAVPYLSVKKYSALNTFSADYTSKNIDITFPFFVKIRDDNTNRVISVSQDGRNWNLLHSVGRTDYLTPTHCGFNTRQGGTSIASTNTTVQARIFHWSLTEG